MSKIAVVGMSALFPEANTPEEFWQNLLDEKNSCSEVTAQELGGEPLGFFSANGYEDDKTYCLNGSYIRDFPGLNNDALALTDEQIEGLDCLNKWALYVAREALKDSGYLGNKRVLSRCGVILGNLSFPTRSSNQLFIPVYHQALNKEFNKVVDNNEVLFPRYTDVQNITPQNGMVSAYPAALISHALALQGVSFALDAACASSLYSVKLACDFLNTGQADMMLAGAISGADPLFVSMGFSIFQAYPENGQSAPLDTSSQGLFAGEGAGMLVLKRYEDAVRDGDKIEGVILGGGLSNDGKGQHVLSPNSKGQVLSYQRAYNEANIDPENVDYIECHATGTPLGDKVEMNSMDQFFSQYNSKPKVGSVKSNLGHLLTAAGMPGMIKIIKGMQHELIPASINVNEPQESKSGYLSGDDIVRTTMDWPQSEGHPKTAGISSFGFGGSNAHVVFQEDSKNLPDTNSVINTDSTVIVGMDAYFGDCNGLAEFDRSIYEGRQHFRELPKERWKGLEEDELIRNTLSTKDNELPEGAYIDEFELDFLRFKIPPNEDDRLIPQQLLLMKTVDRALQDAEIEAGSNVAVLVGMGTEMELHQFRGRVNLQNQFGEIWAQVEQSLTDEERMHIETTCKDSIHGVASLNRYTSLIGNIMACRVSSLWDFSGPAFTISAEENSAFRALQTARTLLMTSDVEAVVVAAVDLAGSMENLMLRSQFGKIAADNPTLSFDVLSGGWLVGEGAGAIVVKRREDALKDENTIYANIDAIEFSSGTDSKAIMRAAKLARETAKVGKHEIGFMEVAGTGFIDQDKAELTAVLSMFHADPESTDSYGNDPDGKNHGENRTCAVGSVKSNIGHTFNAAGIASIIKTALTLHNRYIPVVPGWKKPKAEEHWQNSRLYVPQESKVWLSNEDEHKRTAAISSLGMDGFSCHLILSEEEERPAKRNDYLQASDMRLVLIRGTDQAALAAQLSFIEDAANTSDQSDYRNLCQQLFENYQNGEGSYSAALLVNNLSELLKESQRLQAGLADSFSSGKDWQSPAGSCFSPEPLAKNGDVAFVYPGAFNSYFGLGKDLAYLFPELHEASRHQSSRLATLIGDKDYYPRTIKPMARDEERARLAQLVLDKPINSFENGISYAVTYTDMMREIFDVQPGRVFGFSMGEVSMMYAMGAWGKTDHMSNVLRSTPVFQTRLAGPMETIREAWDLPADKHPENDFWVGFMLNASAEAVTQAIGQDQYVHLILINSPSSVIIAGKVANCQAVIEKLGCDAAQAALGDVIHCDIVRQEYEGLANLHRLHVNPVNDVEFLTAVGYQTLTVSEEAVANNIAEMYCNQVDFPRLVNTAYDRGSRVFVELGPRDGCTRYIGETLGDKPHLAVAINRKGASDQACLFRALARLMSHGVDMKLERLYETRKPAQDLGEKKKPQLIKPVTLGGRPYQERFAELSSSVKISAPAATTNPIPTSGASTVSGESSLDVEKVAAIMLDNVSAKTGYPIEMLELDMDMEADLGIDSIKRVEILGSVQEELPGLPELDSEALAEMRTLKEVVDYMNNFAGASPASIPVEPVVTGVTAAPVVSVEPVVPVALGVTKEEEPVQPQIKPRGEKEKEVQISRMKELASESLLVSEQLDQFEENNRRLNVAHASFLENRQSAMESAVELIALQTSLARSSNVSVESRPAAVAGIETSQQQGVQNQQGIKIEHSLQNQEHETVVAPSQKSSSSAPVLKSEPAVTPRPIAEPAVPAKENVTRMPEVKPKAPEYVKLKGMRRHNVPVKQFPRTDREAGVLWDFQDLTEFAEGDIGKVFGSDYDIIDTYKRRVRLPTTEYLLVTRVTDIDAEMNNYAPSKMITEYDIPYNAWFSVDGQVPWAVSVESGQCDLMLISYLGIDFQNKGDRVYRLLDCTLTFIEDIPTEGQTMRYEISINSFANQGDTLLFFFSYECFVGDTMVIKMDGGAAGFFTDTELDAGKGVIETEAEKEERLKIVKQSFDPFLHCEKSQFDFQDMKNMCAGNYATVLGDSYDQKGLNPGLVFSSEQMLMIERITHLDPKGGSWGLGLIEGEKTLDPEHWYFPCHFKDDQVMAGSLMSDGCGQLLRFFTLYLGMHTHTTCARFQPLPNEPQQVRCRGQVTPQKGTLKYRMEVTEIGMKPYPYAKANIDIILDDRIVTDFKNLGLYLKDGYDELYEDGENISQGRNVVELSGTLDAGSNASSTVLDVFTGDDYPWLRSGMTAPTYTKGLYPPRNPPFKPFANNPLDDNCVPDTLPFTWFHFSEFATGRVANCFGEECNIYDNSIPPRTPNADLQLVSRVVEISGQRHEFKKPAYCIAEFDCPADSWFYLQNTRQDLIPYSIIMEIALQPCGFISAWAGTTLRNPDMDLYFRNLDGKGNLLRDVDLRDKTITNKSTLLSTTSMAGTIIQSFEFELSVDGELFYVGSAVFGYFQKDALTHQLGIDNGKITQGWHVNNNIADTDLTLIDLRTEEMQHRFYEPVEGKPYYHLAGPQLRLVDTVRIVNDGGKEGKGYIFAERDIDKTDWFFECHFHQDPVMPGSLGVEAMYEILQVYALENDLGKQFKNPCFSHSEAEVIWKYRGQITPINKRMSLDLHITSIDIGEDKITLLADGNLSKDGLRIYELKDLVFCIIDAG